jgi:hypothetical protein
LFSFILIIFFVSITILAIKMRKRPSSTGRPYKCSYVICILLVLNWLLYFAGFYTILPLQIADIMFTPIWLILSFLGLLIAFIEYKRSMGIAVPIAWLSIISLVFSLVLYGIGKM